MSGGRVESGTNLPMETPFHSLFAGCQRKSFEYLKTGNE
jgi:hypothetical protein